MNERKGEKGASSLELELRAKVKEMAFSKGIRSEKALNLVSDLVLAFINSITDLPKTDLIEEWKLVAFKAKMTPVCKHPCQFSHDLERILIKAGFRNIHYHLIISALKIIDQERGKEPEK